MKNAHTGIMMRRQAVSFSKIMTDPDHPNRNALSYSQLEGRPLHNTNN